MITRLFIYPSPENLRDQLSPVSLRTVSAVSACCRSGPPGLCTVSLKVVTTDYHRVTFTVGSVVVSDDIWTKVPLPSTLDTQLSRHTIRLLFVPRCSWRRWVNRFNKLEGFDVKGENFYPIIIKDEVSEHNTPDLTDCYLCESCYGGHVVILGLFTFGSYCYYHNNSNRRLNPVSFCPCRLV